MSFAHAFIRMCDNDVYSDERMISMTNLSNIPLRYVESILYTYPSIYLCIHKCSPICIHTCAGEQISYVYFVVIRWIKCLCCKYVSVCLFA